MLPVTSVGSAAQVGAEKVPANRDSKKDDASSCLEGRVVFKVKRYFRGTSVVCGEQIASVLIYS